MLVRRLLCCLFLTAFPVAALADSQSAQSRASQIKALNWQAGSVHLNTSNATVSQPPHMVMVRGAEAIKFDTLVNGEAQQTTEAVAIDKTSGDDVYFQYNDSGYVKVDDWKNVDADRMLDSIKNNTEEANKRRTTQGIPALHMTGWLERPTYDSESNTVRWALAFTQSDGRDGFNAIALILGRHGYQELTWVGDQNEYRSRGGLLDTMIRADHFDQGSRYADFVSGDKIAEYGIAALVGSVAGATLLKTGALAALLLFAKKFIILIIAGIAAALRWLQQRVSGASAKPRAGPRAA